jgi:hypothetical protein
MLSIATVFGRSVEGGSGSLGGYKVVLNSVLISVDFPRPDSPVQARVSESNFLGEKKTRTNDHGCELESLSDTLSVDLVGQICKPDVAHQLFANDRGNTRRLVAREGWV